MGGRPLHRIQWTIEHWLDKDPRVVNAILVAPNDPALAVKEIHRLAHRKDTVAVMPMQTPQLFGKRMYHPIWEACAEHDLPVVSHIGGLSPGSTPTPVGFPSYYMESRMTRPSVASAQAASPIAKTQMWAAVMMPMQTPQLFGKRMYHPIWEACAQAEHDLPVVSHIGGLSPGSTPTPVGFPSY